MFCYLIYLFQLSILCVICLFYKCLCVKYTLNNKYYFINTLFPYDNDTPNIAYNSNLNNSYRNPFKLHFNSLDKSQTIIFNSNLNDYNDTHSGLNPSCNLDSNKNYEYTTETGNSGVVSSLCCYDDSPHLLNQIQSRVNNYDKLTKKYNINPFPEVELTNDYSPLSKVIQENHSLGNGEESDRYYKIFGRVESIRFDGHFMDIVNNIKDFEEFTDYDVTRKKLARHNKLQAMFRLEEPILVYSKSNLVDENDPSLNFTGFNCKDIVSLVDIGDVIELYGNIKRTNLGELSIIPQRIKFLSKCFIPPPSKVHGLKDVETRFRLRHVDLMSNEESRYFLMKRFQTVSRIRKFFTDKKFIELDTPILQHYASGALAEPFSTYYKRLQQDVKLRIAPEFSIKKLFMGLPIDKVFEIGKCFRNEGTSLTHSPEFTMIEVYQKMVDYKHMIDLLEELVNYLLTYSYDIYSSNPDTDPSNCKLTGKKVNVYEVQWTRKTFSDLLKDHTGIDILLHNKDELIEKMNELIKDDSTNHENSLTTYKNWGEVANEIFEKIVVPNLTYPVHVTHLPSSISPLCYFKNEDTDDDRSFSNRFESYLGGMEIANGCTEQCNPMILSKKLLDNRLELSEQGKNNSANENRKESDREFLHAVFSGMEPMSGLGIGVDRLIMYITKTKNIKEVQPLPSLKKQ